MIYKVALASTDGKIVNQHFGHAEKFHIIEIDDNYRYLETRLVSACCKGNEHEISAFELVAEALRDVQAIVVSRIGKGASDYMESKGFVIYEAPYPIDAVMDKIVTEKWYDTDNWPLR